MKSTKTIILRLKIEKFIKEQLWQHALVLSIIALFAWFFDKEIEAVCFCLAHFVLRPKMEKQYHKDTTRGCLMLTACSYDCDKLSVDCYHNLLDGTLCYKQRTCKHNETVGELSERYRDKRLIIRINGHLTCSLYGTIVDIWDCTNKTADVFWIVE